MPAKIPATIVTGFLGSGKTTLIRHLLQNAGGRKIALIINEFGDLGVDGDILKGCGIETCTDDDVVELSNGCICCTVAEDFVPTLEKLLSRNDLPDHIVIETSGLALPQPLVQAFNWPEIATRVTVDGVVTLVDGKAVAEGRFSHDIKAVEAQRAADDTLDHDTPLSELFEDQIACADMIVVNKSDLLQPIEVKGLSDRLRTQSRAGVQVVSTTMGALPADILLGQNAAAETTLETREAPHHHHHDDDDHDHHDDHHHDHDHDHDAFESFVVTRGEIADPVGFTAKISDVIRDFDILRLKGFAAVAGKPMRLTVQAVGPRVDSYFDRRADSRETRLVVIGQSGLDRDAITEALRAA